MQLPLTNLLRKQLLVEHLHCRKARVRLLLDHMIGDVPVDS